jgi:pilus assembly protein Flp/PilA
MESLILYLRELLLDETGAVASEYALLISCIAAAVAGAITIMGGALKGLYENAANKFLAN